MLIAGVQRPAALHILGESSSICLKAPSVMILRRNSQCLEKVPTFGPSLVESILATSALIIKNLDEDTMLNLNTVDAKLGRLSTIRLSVEQL